MINPPFNLKDIKPGEFTYFSRRILQNKDGEEKGGIIIWKRVGDSEHNFVMECPYCQRQGEGKIDLQKRPYRVRCVHCEKSTTLKKLKDEK